jgi:hypothetical protein
MRHSFGGYVDDVVVGVELFITTEFLTISQSF